MQQILRLTPFCFFFPCILPVITKIHKLPQNKSFLCSKFILAPKCVPPNSSTNSIQVLDLGKTRLHLHETTPELLGAMWVMRVPCVDPAVVEQKWSKVDRTCKAPARTDPPSQSCSRFIGPQMPRASRMWNSEVFIFREGSITQLVIH